MLGFEHKSFTFGYSYDMVTSSLNSAVTGLNAHEITLSFKLSRLKKSNIASFGGEGDKNTPSVRSNPFSSF